jgi:hypothetical protein
MIYMANSIPEPSRKSIPQNPAGATRLRLVAIPATKRCIISPPQQKSAYSNRGVTVTTDSTPVGTLQLDQIQNAVQVSNGKALRLLECCVWCLLHCNHPNGVSLKVVDTSKTVFYAVAWSGDGIDADAIKRSYNQDDAIEDGAEAVALLLSVQVTSYTAVERSIKTTGIDYWLGFKNSNPNEPFHRKGRLEISGIMEDDTSYRVSARVNEKKKQTKPTDHTFPVHIIVIEFSKPYATVVLKNANS